MPQAIESAGLDKGIMRHVVEQQQMPWLELVLEKPVAHEIPGQAAIAAKTVTVRVIAKPLFPVGRIGSQFRPVGRSMDGPVHLRHVRQLQAIGHVGGKRNIHDRRPDIAIVHDILHPSQQEAGFPDKSRPRFKNDLQMRPFLAEHLQTGLEFFQIIALAGHQMATAEIDPFQTRQIGRKMRLESIYQMTGIFGIGFAQGMAMETLQPFGHILRPGQVASHDPQTGTGRTRVIDSLHMRMQFRIDPQAERNPGISRTGHLLVTMELVQRIESHMRTHPGHLFHLVLVIRRRIGISRTT